jgi:hypothetical protein
MGKTSDTAAHLSQFGETALWATTRAAALALGLFFTPCSSVIDVITNAMASIVTAKIGNLRFMSSAHTQPAALTQSQSDAFNAYNNALSQFKSILSQRRAQINSKQPLPNLPGQALYLARNNMMSTYKDLTDVLPSKIGRPNKFGIPPAYFDADNEPLIDEYTNIFKIMQAPPANAQNSETPFKDVVDLGTAIAQGQGPRCGKCRRGRPYQPGPVLCRDQRQPEHRKRPLEQVQGKPANRRARRPKWSGQVGAIKKSIAAFDPALIARDDKEEARVGNSDHRYNHWTAVRDGLMNAHANLFQQIPAIAKALPNPIDQMKLFELIQIIPSPTKAALASGMWPTTEFPTRPSWDICATTACSPMGKLTGPKHRQPSARFSTQCGSSTRNSNAPLPNSMRSRRRKKAEWPRSRRQSYSAGMAFSPPVA